MVSAWPYTSRAVSEKQIHQWDPRSPGVLRDQIAAYDRLRRNSPVAHSEYLQWSLFRHGDVVRVLHSPGVFSNAVSERVSVPNGMDPPEHTEYRRMIDGYFTPERMARFEPVCREVAVGLIRRLPRTGVVDFMREFADVFAIEIQCAFLDWPRTLHEPLLRWTRKNHAATLAGDRPAMAAIAVEFDAYVNDLLAGSRRRNKGGRNDVLALLARERVNGRPLSDEEMVSILRNWTVGELSTISACVGILVRYIAAFPEVQRLLRQQTSLLPAAIDEILRIHPPLIASRRRTSQEVKIGGCVLPAGERVTLIWASANRDESIFGNPDEFRPDRNPADNLLYGAGIHACPGAPLARLELRALIEELLKRTRTIGLTSGEEPVPAIYPRSGFSSLPVEIIRTPDCS